MKKLFFALTATLLISALHAQDKIYKIKGPVINAKVIEIGTDEIKYKLTDNPDGPVYVVDKSALNRIEFANGKIEKYQLSVKDPESYQGQLTKAIKINFFAPLLGYTQFSFEKSVTPLKGYEVGFGIIGAGKNSQAQTYYVNGQNDVYKRNAFGAFIDGGYKFNKMPNFFNKGIRMSHVMQGTYVKPSVIFGYYSDNALNFKSGNPVVEKRNNVFGSVLLTFGRQWVFGDKFLVDAYYGLGYAFDNTKQDANNGYYQDYIYNHFVVQKEGSGASLGFSGGIKVGMLIK